MKIAGIQFVGHADREANISTATRMVYDAASQGAKIICLPELFNTMYFCVDERPEYFDWAEPIPGPTIERMADIARETGTVLICPIFERTDEGKFYNSAAIVGPDGEIIGKYRKTHIPYMDRPRDRGPRGNEKFYFEPGDLGYPTFDTPFGVRIGILICYDRHFPEAARALGLGNADIVFMPSGTNGMGDYPWELAWDMELRSHAAFNIYYVCGVNKVGVDVGGSARNHFGSSLIVNPRGEVLTRASSTTEEVITADIDPEAMARFREEWGYYQNRRPDLYGQLVEPTVAASVRAAVS